MASGGDPTASPWPGKPTRAVLAAGLGPAPDRTPHEPPNGSRSARPASSANKQAEPSTSRPRQVLICRVPEVMLPLLLLPKPLFVLLTMLSLLFLSCFALLSCCAGGTCQYPQMRNAALSTQKAADYLSQKALGSVFGGVDILIGLVEKTGEAFSRLTPTHAVVTCVFLLGSFSLVAGFLTVHRGQTIQLGSDALEAEHRANESRDRHDVRSSGSCTSP